MGPYLDGGDVEGGGDAEDGHDDGLVLLIDVDLHLPDVRLLGHQRRVLIGDVGLAGPTGRENTSSPPKTPKTAIFYLRKGGFGVTSGSAARPSARSSAAALPR